MEGAWQLAHQCHWWPATSRFQRLQWGAPVQRRHLGVFAGSGDVSKDSTVRMTLEPSVWDLGLSLGAPPPPGPRRVPPTHGVLGQLLSCPVASYTSLVCCLFKAVSSPCNLATSGMWAQHGHRSVLCSPLYPNCPAWRWHSVTVCWMNDWVDEQLVGEQE